MRRFLFPVVFALVAAACSVGVLRSLDPGLAGNRSGSVRAQATPVLSARRIPQELASLSADGLLDQQLDAAMARLYPTSCGVAVSGGRVIYAHNPDLPLIPASNEKLLTATAALRTLGAAARLRTIVEASAPDATGTIHGDVYLVGGGDPLLTTADYRATLADPALATSLETLADQTVAAGVKHVDGRVIGDESRYDSQRAVATWLPSYTSDHESGPLSALTVNKGWGSFPSKANPRTPLAPSPDPAHTAADDLTLLLAQRGVTVTGGTASGPAPAGLPELTHLDSLPLSDILREMLTESDDQTAELLLKELGHSGGVGSTANGVVVLRKALAAAGLDLAGTIQVDGSGLDRGNRATCHFLTSLLAVSGPLSPLSAGLPVAAQTGTLKGRFGNTPAAGRLRAKTGTLDDVSSLSGFVQTVPGGSVTFSFITNGSPKTAPQAAAEIDFGVDLAGYPQGINVALVGPVPER